VALDLDSCPLRRIGTLLLPVDRDVCVLRQNIWPVARIKKPCPSHNLTQMRGPLFFGQGQNSPKQCREATVALPMGS
jgi:hypothetical protein